MIPLAHSTKRIAIKGVHNATSEIMNILSKGNPLILGSKLIRSFKSGKDLAMGGHFSAAALIATYGTKVALALAKMFEFCYGCVTLRAKYYTVDWVSGNPAHMYCRCTHYNRTECTGLFNFGCMGKYTSYLRVGAPSFRDGFSMTRSAIRSFLQELPDLQFLGA